MAIFQIIITFIYSHNPSSQNGSASFLNCVRQHCPWSFIYWVRLLWAWAWLSETCSATKLCRWLSFLSTKNPNLCFCFYLAFVLVTCAIVAYVSSILFGMHKTMPVYEEIKRKISFIEFSSENNKFDFAASALTFAISFRIFRSQNCEKQIFVCVRRIKFVTMDQRIKFGEKVNTKIHSLKFCCSHPCSWLRCNEQCRTHVSLPVVPYTLQNRHQTKNPLMHTTSKHTKCDDNSSTTAKEQKHIKGNYVRIFFSALFCVQNVSIDSTTKCMNRTHFWTSKRT